LKIPAGSILYGEATYDNTMANPFQPSSPPIDVARGEGTLDEMMLIYFGVLLNAPGDENMVIDTSTIKLTYAGCTFGTDIQAIDNENILFDFYPNPASSSITIEMKSSINKIAIYNVYGEKIIEKNLDEENSLQIDVSAYPSGQYFIRAFDKKTNYTRKLLID
jgi:hypothetical protein